MPQRCSYSVPAVVLAPHLVNPTDLVQLVGPRKEGVQAGYLEEHAARPPLVHLWAVVTIREEAFRSSIPPGRDVLRVRLILTPRESRGGGSVGGKATGGQIAKRLAASKGFWWLL